MRIRIFVLTAIMSLCCATMRAATGYFESGGLKYHITSADGLKCSLASCWDKPQQYKGNIVVPGKVEHDGQTYSVEGIEKHAFYVCDSLESVTFGEGISNIEQNAFYNCSKLRSISFPTTVASVKGDIIYYCYGIEAYSVADAHPTMMVTGGLLYDKQSKALLLGTKAPATVTLRDDCSAVSDYAFYESNLQSITLPASVKTLGEYAFGSSKLESISLEQVKEIGMYCFSRTMLTTITIPACVTYIGRNNFFNTKTLKTVIMADGTETLTCANTKYSDGDDTGMFYTLALDSLYIGRPLKLAPNTNNYKRASSPLYYTYTQAIALGPCLTEIPDYYLYNCYGFGTLVIPEGVTTIGTEAFYKAKNLHTVYIPKTVTSIGALAFHSSQLRNLHVYAPKPPQLSSASSSDPFGSDIKKACSLTVPKGSLSLYKQADVWKDFYNIVEENTDGISAATADSNAQEVYYDLLGRRQETPAGGIFIRVRNGVGQKVLLKK